MKSGGSYHVSYIWSYHSWSETSWRAVWVLIDSGTNFTKPGTCQSVLKAALCLSICRETCPQNNRAIKIELMLSLCQEIWKTQQGPQDWKSSVFIPVPKKGNAKECSNYCTVALISHASNEFKILQARLQQYVNRELPNVQAGFRKGRETTDQIANICWIMEKARELHKNIYFCSIDYAKAFDCVDHNKLKNSEINGNTRPPDLPLEKPIVQVRKQHLELDREQQTGSK